MTRSLLLKFASLSVFLLAANVSVAQTADPAAASTAVQHYRIDLQQSDLHWLVYKGGTLSTFGHNHVISVGKLTGDVYVAPELSESHFKLVMPVVDFVVDNPALRKEQDKDFGEQPGASDIKGTREHMLGDKQLDASKYPDVIVTGTGPTGPAGAEELHLTITITGHVTKVTVPTKVTINGDTLEASGKFDLKQTAIGITPFSIFLGALQVADKMDFSYHIVAHRVP